MQSNKGQNQSEQNNQKPPPNLQADYLETLTQKIVDAHNNPDPKVLQAVRKEARTLGISWVQIKAAEYIAQSVDSAEKEEEAFKAKPKFLNKDVGYTGPRWAVDQWYQKGALHLIGGEKSGSKSTFVIAQAVRNAREQELWKGGPNGDGRKSLYIGERSAQDARDKVLAAGGKPEDLDILTHIHYSDGHTEKIDLDNHQHFAIIIMYIHNNNYWAIIVDPVVELVLDAQNDNKKMRRALRQILEEIEDTDTFILGTAHLRKVRADVNDMGAFRGATELVNMCSGVFRVYDKAEDPSYKILLRLAVNRSKQSTTGGLEYKVVGKDMESTKDKKTYNEGYIKEITERKGSKEMLRKQCASDMPGKEKKDYYEIVKNLVRKELIRWVNDGRQEHKLVSLKFIKELARAEDDISEHFAKNKITKALLTEWQEELNFDIKDSVIPKGTFLIPR